MLLNTYGKLLETYSYDYEVDEENKKQTMNADYFRYNSEIDDIDGAIRYRKTKNLKMSTDITKKQICYVRGNKSLEAISNLDNLYQPFGISDNKFVTLPTYPLKDRYIVTIGLFNYENAEEKTEDDYKIKINFHSKDYQFTIDKNLSVVYTECLDYAMFRSYPSICKPHECENFHDFIYILDDGLITTDYKTNSETLGLGENTKDIKYHLAEYEFDILNLLPDEISLADSSVASVTYNADYPFIISDIIYKDKSLIQSNVSTSLEEAGSYEHFELIYPSVHIHNIHLASQPFLKLWNYDWFIVVNGQLTSMSRMIYYVEDEQALINAIEANEDPFEDRFPYGYLDK